MQHQRTGPAAAVVRTKQDCISICNAKTQGMQQLEAKRYASAAVRSQGAAPSFLSIIPTVLTAQRIVREAVRHFEG